MAHPFLKGQIVCEQPRKGVLSAHLNTFMSVVSDLGYSSTTIQTQLTLLKGFMRWIEKNHVVAYKINEDITDRFLIESNRKGAVRRGDNRTLHRFLDHLRFEGTIPHLKPTFNDSPMTLLKNRYEDYLQKERGLSPEAGPRYWPYIQRFLLDRFGDKPMRFCQLGPQDIDHFILSHAHKRTPKSAQLMVSALRSFLRFLFRFCEKTT